MFFKGKNRFLAKQYVTKNCFRPEARVYIWFSKMTYEKSVPAAVNSKYLI